MEHYFISMTSQLLRNQNLGWSFDMFQMKICCETTDFVILAFTP